MNIDELDIELKKQFNINIEDLHTHWDDFRENYYRRNAIVHNDGIIDDNYVEKLNLDELSPNEITYNYVVTVFQNIQTLVEILKEKLIEKFNLPDTWIYGQITEE
jgi:hypothetical protein